uniref:Uncharacterized protein n=1 Tax=Tanacetum cinerariifolium TaxID=118510 RepID=A0A6L2JHS0_TANCI|nr:uncharacterized protein [Tanacetum cinerariifolium]
MPESYTTCTDHEKQNKHTSNQTIQCVTELRRSGIKLKARQSSGILDIEFKNGLLEIPTIIINDFTMNLITNCLAWEQCCIDAFTYITDYIYFLNCLINGPRDVALLCGDGIIVRHSRDDASVVSFFNSLGDKLPEVGGLILAELSGLILSEDEKNDESDYKRLRQISSFTNFVSQSRERAPNIVGRVPTGLTSKDKLIASLDFGVVLLDLLPGKQPIDPSFGESVDIVEWGHHRQVLHLTWLSEATSCKRGGFRSEEASKCPSALPMRNRASGVPKIQTDASSTRNKLLIECDHGKDKDNSMWVMIARQCSAPLTASDAGSEHVGSGSVEPQDMETLGNAESMVDEAKRGLEEKKEAEALLGPVVEILKQQL